MAAASASSFPEPSAPQPPRAASQQAQTSPKSPAKKRILIVEDDIASANALRYVLMHLGHEVQLVQTVSEALRALHVSSPELVVLDLMLPDGDGAAILERARQAYPKTSVVVTTGVSDPQWLQSVQALNPTALLLKPVKMDDLQRYL